jgi:DNA-binding response OmpR family regulator
MGKLAEKEYSLLVLDWNLPHGVGKKILDRTVKAYPSLPILVMSGMEIELKEKRPQVCFLQKPFDPLTFRRRAKELMETRP